jgi:CRP/FNR family transcriptional regulator, cyclic AMP receptor protein
MADIASGSSESKSFLFDGGSGRSITQWRRGQVVFSQGDPADAVFYIRAGKVKVTTLSPHAKEAVVAILGPGDFFGEACLAGQPLRIATVVVMADSVIARLEKVAVVRALHEELSFAEMFMTHLLARNIRMESDLIDQLFNSSEKRLARLLLLLSKFGTEGGPQPVVASQQTLAEMIGTTRARVSFFMNKFRRLGFIDYGDQIDVRSTLLNVVLSDDHRPVRSFGTNVD